jgi:regulator of sigma E protease
MLDEREAPVAPHELDQAFNRKPLWARAAIVAAGPLANLLLAVLLYAGGALDRRGRAQGRDGRPRGQPGRARRVAAGDWVRSWSADGRTGRTCAR